MSNLLKGCPFCGGKAEMYRGKPLLSSGKPSFVCVYCEDCRGRTGEMYDEDYAIEKWNTRAPIDTSAIVAELLEEATKALEAATE